MAIRTRSLQNCWGRDQRNHKTVDGQGLHEGQGQQPVERSSSRALYPIRQILARPLYLRAKIWIEVCDPPCVQASGHREGRLRPVKK